MQKVSEPYSAMKVFPQFFTCAFPQPPVLPCAKTVLSACALLFICSAATLGAASNIIAPGATLQKLASDFVFTEGPACDAQGNVFFTDQPNDRILKWSVDGKLSTFMQP